jgi:hypothetical protein
VKYDSRKPTSKSLDFCGVEKSRVMALNVSIDLENIYPTVYKYEQQRSSMFDTILKDGRKMRMGVKISLTVHPLMHDVYNLAFGPVERDGSLNDKVRLSHQDHSKVFSTVLFEILSFLTDHPDKRVGIDGSNYARAYMYYRCIQNNFDYLNTVFKIIGIKYYIRMLREGADGTCELDEEDIQVLPKELEANESMKPGKLYNYFIFSMPANGNTASSIFKN